MTQPRSWIPSLWLAQWTPLVDTHDRRRMHVFRARYYTEHHMPLVREGCYTSQSGKVVHIDNDPIALMNATIVYDGDSVYAPRTSEWFDTEFSVTCADCLHTARRFEESAVGKTAVLNLANRQRPGGGVYTGSGAQEESCYLRSNYFLATYPHCEYAAQHGLPSAPGQYPMDRNYGGCYSEGITIFRGTEKEGYPLLDEPWKTNFIAVAALNRPPVVHDAYGELRLRDDMVEPTKRKLRTIFNIALDRGITNLVLGALGCGAFRNPPRHMAELFRSVLSEAPYEGAFRRVNFTITNRQMCDVFADVFGTEVECP